MVHIDNSLLLSLLAKERVYIFIFYGIRRVQSLGKALASRTFVNSNSLYTILSNPIPKPPCGDNRIGMYLNKIEISLGVILFFKRSE